jgi:TatD DNase family protein
VIHSRNAFDELHDTLTRCRANELTGVFHCYSGDEEQLARLARFEGFMFGVGGVVTYKKSNLPEILRHLPLERVLLETDSPYLAPVPRRGKRNESAYIPYIAERVAQIYGTTVENVAAVTTANAERLFAI